MDGHGKAIGLSGFEPREGVARLATDLDTGGHLPAGLPVVEAIDAVITGVIIGSSQARVSCSAAAGEKIRSIQPRANTELKTERV